MKTYPGCTADVHKSGLPPGTRFRSTGETREVRPGEWFISGARPCAYLVPKGFSPARLIAKPIGVLT